VPVKAGPVPVDDVSWIFSQNILQKFVFQDPIPKKAAPVEVPAAGGDEEEE
jgi:hypothetical protein